MTKFHTVFPINAIINRAIINAKIETTTSLYPARFSGPGSLETQSIPARHKSRNISTYYAFLKAVSLGLKAFKPSHNELIPSQEPDVVSEQTPSASLPLLPTSNNRR